MRFHAGLRYEITEMLEYPWLMLHKFQSKAELAGYLERGDAENRAASRPTSSENKADRDLALLEFGRLLLNNIRQYGFPTWYEWSKMVLGDQMEHLRLFTDLR